MNDPNQLISQIFRQYLGRDPNPYEIQGFGGAIQNGYLDPIGLTMFLQSTAEYQKAQAGGVAQQYAQQLTPLMDKAAQHTMDRGFDAARSRFAQAGRPDSSGLASAYAQVTKDLAAENSRFVGQGVGGYLGGAYGGMTGYQQQGFQPWMQGQGRYQDYVTQGRLMNQKMSYPGVAGARDPWENANQWAQLGGGLLNTAGKAAQLYMSGGMSGFGS